MSILHTACILPFFTSLLFSLIITVESKSEEPAPQGWDEKMQTVRYPSPMDNSLQPAIVYIPENKNPVPLLVTLHTWSGDYRQPAQSRAAWCIENNWALIAPDFRGPNTTPQGCGSELVVADIVAAVEYMKTRTNIDTDRIYLMGSSGGGYGSLLMVGRHPEIWAGVSAWCGITDLEDWYYETLSMKLHYADDIEKSCGGKPDESAEVDKQYRLRSANTEIHNAGRVPLDINHGIHDGHLGSVPVSHSIKAFNLLAVPDKRISDEEMQYFCEERKVPEKLKTEVETDPLFGTMAVLFRRISGNTRLTIFDGGHSSAEQAGLHWLALQRKGKDAGWSIAVPNSKQDNSEASEVEK